jgi:hypothetical protein
LVVLAIFIGVHFLLNKLLAFVMPAEMQKMKLLMEDILWICFALIYVYLAWETLAAFIPWLRRGEYRGQPGSQLATKEVEE